MAARPTESGLSQPVPDEPRPAPPDAELKARHRAMWASGDYPSMVETWLLPLGPRLVEACDIVPGMHVLDVGAGTGNASIPAAQRGASVTASDLTPDLLDRRHVRPAPPGRRRRARPRLPPGRHDRPAELDARGPGRRALPHHGPVRAAASAGC